MIKQLSMKSICLWCVALATLLAIGAHAEAGIIAYVVDGGGSEGRQGLANLGMDFDVNQAITVTHLGVFDHEQNGLLRELTGHIYDRTNTSSPLATLVFATGATGDLIGGSRFLPLASPLELAAGFQGTIVAENYGTSPEELNGNKTPVFWTTDDGGGAISFVGTGRWDTVTGQFPSNVDGGTPDEYAAGTFTFEVVSEPVPEPGALALLATALACLLCHAWRKRE